ncbi:MAG: hypothetical protein Q9205_003513 [Flavoplaca limonia]
MIVPSPLNSNYRMNTASSDTRLYPVIASFFSSLMVQINGLMTEINGVVPAAWSDSPPQPTIEPGYGHLSSRMMSRDGWPIPWELLDWFGNEISHGTPALEESGGSSAIVPQPSECQPQETRPPSFGGLAETASIIDRYAHGTPIADCIRTTVSLIPVGRPVIDLQFLPTSLGKRGAEAGTLERLYFVKRTRNE